MNQEQAWQEFNTLSPAARQQVINFIAFLRSQNDVEQAIQNTKSTLQDEPFVGMWQDYKVMSDSTAWVRESRRQEWGKS
jgi:hypothetical protein